MISDYLNQIYNVFSFLVSRENPQTHKNVIFLQSVKCIVIGAALGGLLRFARGEFHYRKYMNWMTSGAVLGASYSFYFTNKKV